MRGHTKNTDAVIRVTRVIGLTRKLAETDRNVTDLTERTAPGSNAKQFREKTGEIA
jgi:hypothetical protein